MRNPVPHGKEMLSHCEPHLILKEMIYYTYPSFPLPVLYVHLCTRTSFPLKDRSEEINCNV